MARHHVNIRYRRFGKLVAVEPTFEVKRLSPIWVCRCDCGRFTEKTVRLLTAGSVKSCGCLLRTHGLSGTKEYTAFANRKRQLAKLKRTPIWSDLELIRVFYMNCPEGYQIDHIAPLCGALVSGLHVPENLQYLLASDNQKKHNKFTPYSEVRSTGQRVLLADYQVSASRQ
jgi:hypothetical protein